MSNNSRSVIDNKNIFLSDKLNKEVIPYSKNVDIAVGYFFISGFGVIVKELKKLEKIRILISNATDEKTKEALQLGFHNIKKIQEMIENNKYVNTDKQEDIKKETIFHHKKSLQYIEQTKENYDTINDMLEMMVNGKLEIRVKKGRKLHAKAYLFEARGSRNENEGYGIVGSSNLSKAALYENSELNLETTHDGDISVLKSWFEDLWKDGIESTDDFRILFSESWAGKKEYSAEEVFHKAIYDEYKNKIADNYDFKDFKNNIFKDLYQFQSSAVSQAMKIVLKYNGVMIADVVGMGKTFIGLALLKYLQQNEGYSPLVICPPALEEMWKNYLRQYEIEADIISSGILSSSDKDEQLTNNYLLQGRNLILIDESHNFRNNNSLKFENLDLFMKKPAIGGKYRKAILLSATPLANEYSDIRNQIQLFHPQYPETDIPPANLTDLDVFFGSIENNEAELVNFLQKILIRRTRKYLMDTWGKKDKYTGRVYIEKIKKSCDKDGCKTAGREIKSDGTCDECGGKVQDTLMKNYFPDRILKTSKYNIDKTYKNKFEDIVNLMSKLELIRYNYGTCVKKESQGKKPYSELVEKGKFSRVLYKYILLKRMESSPRAFSNTIKKQIIHTKLHIKVINRGKVPTEKIRQYNILDYDNIHDIDTEDTTMDENMLISDIYDSNAFDFKRMKKSIKNDLKLLEEIYAQLPKQPEKTDDKLKRLQKILDHQYMDKKILIFTQFTDTAKYIKDEINWGKRKVEQVDSSKNVLNYARRFDNKNNPDKRGNVVKIQPKNEIDILVTTDVLSEGVNLQAGQVVINYDFHWNPVKLIQRAGRIDRIGSERDKIYLENFLACKQIEEHIGINGIVQDKIDSIQKIIGTDSRILTSGEAINPNNPYAGDFRKRMYEEDGKVLDEMAESDPLSVSIYENAINRLKSDDSKWNKFMQIPDGIRNSVYAGNDGKLLVTFVSGNENNQIKKSYLIDGQTKKVEVINSERMCKILEYNKNKKTINFSKKTYDELISLGIKKFENDVLSIEQNKYKQIRKSRLQNNIIKKLTKLQRNTEDEDFNDEDYKIIKNLKNKFEKRKITSNRFISKELKKLMDDDNLSDKEFLDKVDLITENISIETSDKEAEINLPPRILYSEYLNDKKKK